MKKRSRIVSLGVLALTLTMMSTCLMGATMARYVTEVTGSATAAVAAWSFKANGETSTLTAIDLGADGKREAYNENNIMKGVVAPGTKGSFDIVIDGTGSEVGIEYAVTIAEGTNVTLPDDLVFSTEAITADKPGSKLDVFLQVVPLLTPLAIIVWKRPSLSTGNGRLTQLMIRNLTTMPM